MIKFNNLNQDISYQLLKEKYDEALNAGQKGIEAVSISSFNKETNEVDSRFVNLKFITNDEFIFFSNYESPKAAAFNSHNQIAALFYWDKINTQIRIKAKIYKLDESLSDSYFKNRLKEKNALAISSVQSESISSFDLVKKNYLYTLENEDLSKRPKSWGGYRFVPYEFEFWLGHKHRLNQRTHFKLSNGVWKKTLLQP